MRVDSLLILGPSLVGDSLSVADAVRIGGESGVDAFVAAPAKPREYLLSIANDALAAAAAGKPNLHRLARVDPNQGAGAIAELRRCVDELGCVGLFLNPDEELFRAQDAAPVVRAARDLGIPTVISAGMPARSEPLQILELAREVPDATIVLTSGGQLNISGLSMVDAWVALTAHDNLYVLSDGEYRQNYLERIVRELGAERLLFASSAPRFDQRFELARITNLALSPAERALVEGENAARLFVL
ncbi:MAG: amidohydrolase family protein [Microbacteriaceae bacterium]